METEEDAEKVKEPSKNENVIESNEVPDINEENKMAENSADKQDQEVNKKVVEDSDSSKLQEESIKGDGEACQDDQMETEGDADDEANVKPGEGMVVWYNV